MEYYNLKITEHWSIYKLICIKTSGSESRGQEEAACMRVLGQEEAACMRILGLCDHYSELFTRMEALNF